MSGWYFLQIKGLFLVGSPRTSAALAILITGTAMPLTSGMQNAIAADGSGISVRDARITATFSFA